MSAAALKSASRIKHALLAAAFAAGIGSGPTRAQNSCTCTCFDGRPQGSCTTPGEVAICLPDICPPKPPVLIPAPQVKPPAVTCTSQLVWNAATRQYDYKRTCKPQAF